jgi:hypothetical protein
VPAAHALMVRRPARNRSDRATCVSALLLSDMRAICRLGLQSEAVEAVEEKEKDSRSL